MFVLQIFVAFLYVKKYFFGNVVSLTGHTNQFYCNCQRAPAACKTTNSEMWVGTKTQLTSFSWKTCSSNFLTKSTSHFFCTYYLVYAFWLATAQTQAHRKENRKEASLKCWAKTEKVAVLKASCHCSAQFWQFYHHWHRQMSEKHAIYTGNTPVTDKTSSARPVSSPQLFQVFPNRVVSQGHSIW